MAFSTFSEYLWKERHESGLDDVLRFASFHTQSGDWLATTSVAYQWGLLGLPPPPHSRLRGSNFNNKLNIIFSIKVFTALFFPQLNVTLCSLYKRLYINIFLCLYCFEACIQYTNFLFSCNFVPAPLPLLTTPLKYQIFLMIALSNDSLVLLQAGLYNRQIRTPPPF